MAQPVDSFGRTIDTLRMSVTNLCNERCIYCMPSECESKRAHIEELSIDELFDIVKAAAELGISKIRLTGGEPLIRQGLLDLCRRICNLDKIKELCITTNGLLLSNMASELAQAGVNRINMSLDTLKEYRYREITRVGTLGKALDGLHAALANFKSVKINTVLIGGVNDDEIGDFIELTRNEPIEVRFLELMPIGECIGWGKERFVSADEVLRRFPSHRKIENSGVAERYKLDGYTGTVGLIRPISSCFCADCSRIRVTSDGMLKPCLHSNAEIPLRGLTGDTIKEKILSGIMQKPARHTLSLFGSESGRHMNEIGG